MIELALVAPLIVLFLLGMVDVGRGISAKYELVRASARTLELGTAMGVSNGSYDYLKQEAAAIADVPPENVQVDYWLECNFERMADFNSACESPNLPFRYIRVTITDIYEPMFIGAVFTQAETIVGSSAVRVQ